MLRKTRISLDTRKVHREGADNRQDQGNRGDPDDGSMSVSPCWASSLGLVLANTFSESAIIKLLLAYKRSNPVL